MTAPFDVLWALLALFAGVMVALVAVHGWGPLCTLSGRGGRRAARRPAPARDPCAADTVPGVLFSVPAEDASGTAHDNARW